MKKILVIEDMASLREEIVQTLECLDFHVIEAENGAMGVQLAQKDLPDLIICDIMMPELDGYGVLQALRHNRETASIPFIFLTAKADKSDFRQGMNLGADDYLTKPFTTDELSDAIASRLEKKAALAEPYIAEIKQASQQLSQLAERDPLTNLPNRIFLLHRLQETLIQASQARKIVAILCINVEDFKSINATFGHSTGDLLLQQIAERLTACARPRDIVARLNGDEFGVVLVDIIEKQEVADLAKHIQESLCQTYRLSDREISIRTSIGISLYPEDSNNLDKLLNYADTARRCSKNRGSVNYEFYSCQLDNQAAERHLMETQLSYALEREEFEIYYQPQVDLISGRIIGAEALLRWHNSALGRVSPAQFIPLAEETGLIVAIGEWVLRTACAQAQNWQTSRSFPMRISVNLSARQFKQKNLIETITEVFNQTHIAPSNLDLELTETSVMEDVEATITTLHELKAMGIHLSIDDFGTGYSSLNYIKRFPVDNLKIDRSFVKDITSDTLDAAIAEAIIAMAKSLQLQVIAEGVETEEQLAFLRERGCHAIQGYLFSPPISAAEFEKLLLEDKHL